MEIQIKQLSHRYPKSRQAIIQHLDVDFSKGCIHGIVGDNGAGKTTLLRLIAGLEPLQLGEITIGGQKISLQRVRDHRIVYVASKPVVLSGSVLHNATVALTSRGLPISDAQVRVKPFLEQLDLWRLKDQSARTLSSGEGQKLALARALALRPKVLLVDEPTGNIDVSMTPQVEEMIRKTVALEATTVILVSHDLEQVSRVADVGWRLSVGGSMAKDEVMTCYEL